MRQFSFFNYVLLFILFLCPNIIYVSGQSVYLKDVTIPEYDSSNSEHFLISSKADWSHINDSDKRFFYVKPDPDYGQRIITANGTESAPRYVSLYNGNNTHPAKLSPEEQASVKLIIDNAHYWVIDRLSSLDYDNENVYCYEIKGNSGNIIFNRIHMSNFYKGIIIRGTASAPYTHDITIQNSRFNNMSPAGIDGDAVAILLMGNYWNTPGTVKNTKILNNEIKNCNDGIMPIKMPQFVGKGNYYVDYPGTIIDGNHIYVDTSVYTDGNGNYDPNGRWAFTENAVDIKGGSNDPDNPMIISNNYFWGYRRTDQHGGGSGSLGTALAAHYYVKNIIIKNNVIFNSNRGIVFAGVEELPAYPTVENAVVAGNILYDIGYNTDGGIGICNLFDNAKTITFEANTIVGKNRGSHWLELFRTEPVKVIYNNIVNAEKEAGTRSDYTSFMGNSFYHTEMRNGSDGYFFKTATEANLDDLIFITDRLTNTPRQIMIPGVVTTKKSPHFKRFTTYLK
jgi:hypothetical protein